MSSMAAAISSAHAASTAAAASASNQNAARQKDEKQGGSLPARLLESIDVEGEVPIEGVTLSGTALLKILKHSTDSSPIAQAAPTTREYNAYRQDPSFQSDAVGILLGLDLKGTAEVVDSWALPVNVGQGAGLDGEKIGSSTYPATLLKNLAEVSALDSPVGIYLSTYSTLFTSALESVLSGTFSASQNSRDTPGGISGTGFLTRQVVELMNVVERMQGGRGKGGGRAVLLVHDAARSLGGDVSLKAYKFSEGFATALKKQRFDTASLIEHRLTPATLLTPLKLQTKSPALLNALISSLSAPQPQSSLATIKTGSTSSLPPSFMVYQNTLPTTLPVSMINTLSSLSTLSQEQNNLAYQVRQVAREKSKHDQNVQRRQEENEQRKAQGLPALPDVAEPVGRKMADPSRLEVLFSLGSVDAMAKELQAEAGKGLARVFASG